MKLNSQEETFWQNYCKSLPHLERPQKAQVSAAPAGNFAITDELIALYLAGEKSAGSSLVEDFKSCADPLPQVGNYWIVLNRQKEPQLLLKTIKIEIHKFAELPAYIALAEGEGDKSVEYWKKVHREFYTPYLQKWGIKNLDEAQVITEFFEIVYRA